MTGSRHRNKKELQNPNIEMKLNGLQFPSVINGRVILNHTPQYPHLSKREPPNGDESCRTEWISKVSRSGEESQTVNGFGLDINDDRVVPRRFLQQ